MTKLLSARPVRRRAPRAVLLCETADAACATDRAASARLPLDLAELIADCSDSDANSDAVSEANCEPGCGMLSSANPGAAPAPLMTAVSALRADSDAPDSSTDEDAAPALPELRFTQLFERHPYVSLRDSALRTPAADASGVSADHAVSRNAERNGNALPCDSAAVQTVAHSAAGGASAREELAAGESAAGESAAGESATGESATGESATGPQSLYIRKLKVLADLRNSVKKGVEEGSAVEPAEAEEAAIVFESESYREAARQHERLVKQLVQDKVRMEVENARKQRRVE